MNFRFSLPCLATLGWAFAAGCGLNPQSALSSRTIYTLTGQQARGPIGVSPDGRTLAFSDGRNIFTIDLDDLNADPVQVTDQDSAFAPSFLSNDEIIFGTTRVDAPDTIVFQTATTTATMGTPAPVTSHTLTATDLGFAPGTALAPPSQFSFNAAQTTGIGTINGQPFVVNFGTTPVTVTPLLELFGESIRNPVFSSDMTSFSAINGAGQVIAGPVAHGVIVPSDITPVDVSPVGAGAFAGGAPLFGVTSFPVGMPLFGTALPLGASFPGMTAIANGASFPSFLPNGQLTYFTPNGFINRGSTGQFTTFGLGSPATIAAYPSYSPTGSSFFTTGQDGTTFIETTFPGPAS